MGILLLSLPYIALQSVDAIIAILQWRKQRIRYHFSKGTVLRFEFELYHRFKWLQSLFFLILIHNIPLLFHPIFQI